MESWFYRWTEWGASFIIRCEPWYFCQLVNQDYSLRFSGVTNFVKPLFLFMTYSFYLAFATACQLTIFTSLSAGRGWKSHHAPFPVAVQKICDFLQQWPTVYTWMHNGLRGSKITNNSKFQKFRPISKAELFEPFI